MRLDFELGMNAKDLKKGFTEARGDLSKLKDAFEKSLGSLPTGKVSKEIKEVEKQLKGLISQVEKLQQAGKGNLTQATPRRQNIIAGGTEQAADMLKNAGPTKVAAKETKELAAVEREAAKVARLLRAEEKALADQRRAQVTEIQRLEKATRDAVFGNEDLARHAITLRYALYDVSAVAGNAGRAFMGFSKNVMTASMNQEKSFSQVQKALVGIDPSKLQELQDELVSLSRQVPVTFDDLAKIGMLGAQLGVQADNIATFTDTVAKFSAITGMTADATALGFGKIANLLGLSSDQYKALGASIAFVGNSSAATEEQIVNTAGQISAVGKAAGLSASQIIGLSSTMASLKIAPEEARSVLVQLFNTINQSTLSYVDQLGKGNDKLKVFAEIAGVTQQEFVAAWGDKSGGAADIWSKFVENLGKKTDVQDALGNVSQESYNVGEVLKKLGLDGVRTSKGITALAKNFTMLSDQMKQAKEAGKTGDFLDRSFATIAEDMASKVMTLQSSFNALYASMGNNEVVKGTFGFIVDAIKNFTIALTALNSNPIGSVLSGLVLIVTTLVGALLTAVSVFAIAAGSMLAFRTAMANAATMGVGFSSTLVNLLVTLRLIPPAVAANVAALEVQRAEFAMSEGAAAAYSGSMAAATTATKVFGISLKSMLIGTGIGALVVILGSVIGAFMEMGGAGDEAERGLDEVSKQAIQTKKDLDLLRSEVLDLFDAIAEISDNDRKLQTALYNLGVAAAGAGQGFVDGAQKTREFYDQVNTVINAATMLYGESQQDLGNYLTQYLDFLVATGTATDGIVTYIQAKINSLTFEIDGIERFSGDAFKEGFNSVQKSAAGASKEVETLLEKVQKALKALNARFSMAGSLRELGASLKEVGKSFNIMTSGGAANLDALNSTIEAIVTAAGENAKVAADDLVALRTAMWRMGITSSTAFIAVNKAIKATGASGKASTSDINKFIKLISTGMKDATQKNVRTIRDWADDINTIMDTAFDIRYGATQSLDAITTAWQGMRDSADDAADAIKAADQALAGLSADKNILEYQLKIALKYGDNLRADRIQAELDAKNSEIAQQTEDRADATAKASKALTGDSAAAVTNRANVLDLVKAYQQYLVTMSATTTDSTKLKQIATDLTADFMKQGTELGYSKEELQGFADAINTDYVTAINNAPKDITLNIVGVDPAVAAVADFVSRANIELDKIKVIDISGNVITVDANANGAPAPVTNTNPPSSLTNSTGAGTVTNSNNNNNGSGVTGGGTTVTKAKKPTTSAGAGYEWKYNATTNKWFKSKITSANTTSQFGSNTPWAQATTSTASASQKASYTAAWTDVSDEMTKWNKKSDIDKFFMQIPHDLILGGAFGDIKRLEGIFPALKNLRPAKYKNVDVSSLSNARKSGLGFSSGGYVSGPGGATTDSITARLSNGEFVMSAAAVKTYGVDFMNSLNSLQNARPSFNGGAGKSASTGGNMVYLSPEDRQLLRAAADRPIALYTENVKIAQSANAGNVLLAQRGSN